ncbi:hypothetical protein WHR41_00429 [Cladosporium halotolerans]|uniref:Amidohydrolase-related domain-containing protein n=1 Tax=Cladosporium halotolerans TaxID=1052096 RepID=A0AB34L792_9PEZI
MLTAGIVDMHSHAGDSPLPETRGGTDDNEMSSDTTPYVRSLDAINPLDYQIEVIKSGGVTTSLILPGSGNNIGGEAFVIKHAVGKSDGRPELSAEDMLADPDRNWRYMKMACGENAKAVYGRVGRDFGPVSRMGEAWEFRHAFDQARDLVQAQDDWCAAADQVGAEAMQEYLPQDLKRESLAAVLRGQVHVNTHCYTVPDLEAFVRHTNEFKFPVRAFHHAHQTYLVPEILKRNYGGRAPAAALFADNMYYKVEAYIGSEQAGKILHENGITPVYVSDNPVLNAQHVLFEAAKAYKYGLPYHVALAGVTSASAELLGLGERIGKVKEGFDGDLALWDSDPLSVGATPVQVWIDGISQFQDPVELKKPSAKPIDREAALEPSTGTSDKVKSIVFTGVSKLLLSDVQTEFSELPINVVVKNGRIDCTGPCEDVIGSLSDAKTVHLSDGYFAPPATAFGSYLGVEEISAEEVTNDGGNNAQSFSAAIDGLSLDSKSLEAAYAHGVTRAISAPAYEDGGHKGVSVAFRVNAKHALEKHAILRDHVAVHYPLTLDARGDNTPSISSLVDALKVKLLKALSANETTAPTNTEAESLRSIVHDGTPLVITVHKADTIASLIRMKSAIDARIKEATSSSASLLRLIILGGAEAHLLAPELAAANVSIVLAPPFPYAESWDQRRSLTGAPLTNGTAIDVLLEAGVNLALGTAEDWQTRDLYLFAGIAHANGGGKINEKEALGLVSGNVYEMLGLEGLKGDWRDEWVVSEGHPLQIPSRIVAVADGNGEVDVWS